jgi:glyoxylase-like metal-dependent hydrolase (beta-lactamase superfamily II)/rhodanese-related sulfurtransferase
VVVDPQRDIDRVEMLLAEHGLTVRHVCETHAHNDYVSGGWQLARRHNASYIVPADAELAFEHTGVRDGDSFGSGGLVVGVLATPGHTPHHVAYTVRRAGTGLPPGDVTAVFTGGSMLYGAVGRPDLVSPELTETQTHDQWHSVQRLARELDGRVNLYPTHGFGSFCAATQNEGTAGTIGDERSTNPGLIHDEATFVTETLAGLDVFPAYYAHMGPANTVAPAAVDLTLPNPAPPAEIGDRVARGEGVIDLRSREVYAEGHRAGTLSFDLDGPFIAYVGWLIPWNTPITLLGESTEQVHAAQRELVRIGIDRPVAQAVGGPEFWSDDALSETTPRVQFPKLADIVAEEPSTYVLDVRQRLEWDEGHVIGSHHLPFYLVPDQVNRIPRDRPVYVACGSGYRAAAVVSLLRSQAGSWQPFDNLVHVDDDWANALKTSLPIESAPLSPRKPGWTWSESRAAVRRFSPKGLRSERDARATA